MVVFQVCPTSFRKPCRCIRQVGIMYARRYGHWCNYDCTSDIVWVARSWSIRFPKSRWKSSRSPDLMGMWLHVAASGTGTGWIYHGHLNITASPQPPVLKRGTWCCPALLNCPITIFKMHHCLKLGHLLVSRYKSGFTTKTTKCMHQYQRPNMH